MVKRVRIFLDDKEEQAIKKRLTLACFVSVSLLAMANKRQVKEDVLIKYNNNRARGVKGFYIRLPQKFEDLIPETITVTDNDWGVTHNDFTYDFNLTTSVNLAVLSALDEPITLDFGSELCQ